MIVTIETKKQAASYWVNGFNAVSYSMFEKAYAKDGLENVRVLASPMNECEHCGASVEVDAKYCEYCGHDGLYPTRDLPMWGTLWSFGEGVDEDWCKKHAPLVASCGFIVYETDDDEIFLGIDGAGYDFYESHWIPLYEARGLHWHESE